MKTIKELVKENNTGIDYPDIYLDDLKDAAKEWIKALNNEDTMLKVGLVINSYERRILLKDFIEHFFNLEKE